MQMPAKEMGAVLEISDGAVRVRLNRAREKLRNRLAALAESEELLKTTMDNLERWVLSIRGRVARDDEGG